MPDTVVTISRRFNGPPNSGQGGYVSGLIADRFAGPVEVTLRAPPPLDMPLRITEADGAVQVSHGDLLLAEGRASDAALEVPAAPDWNACAQAESAYLGHKFHAYPTCFACGPRRAEGDGLRIFTGPVAGTPFFAATWTPHPAFATDGGEIPGTIVWSALDCASGWPVVKPDPDFRMLMGRVVGHVRKLPRAGERCRSFGWPLGAERRKLFGASAIVSEGGDVLAWCRTTWIELQPKPSAGNP